MDSRDKFAQMLREGYETLDPEKEQREYIRELLSQKEQQRKRRIKTITAVAAAFLIVVGAVLAVGGCFGSVEADKNDRTKVEEQDGSVVISDENADGQEVMPETAMTTDWNKVDKLKEKYPEMITFTDVPEGMEFVSVEVINQKKHVFRTNYCYMKGNEEIYICQRKYFEKSRETQGVEEIQKCKEYNGYNVYMDNNNDDDGGAIAIVDSDFGMIDIMGRIDEQAVFDILDKIKASN